MKKRQDPIVILRLNWYVQKIGIWPLSRQRSNLHITQLVWNNKTSVFLPSLRLHNCTDCYPCKLASAPTAFGIHSTASKSTDRNRQTRIEHINRSTTLAYHQRKYSFIETLLLRTWNLDPNPGSAKSRPRKTKSCPERGRAPPEHTTQWFTNRVIGRPLKQPNETHYGLATWLSLKVSQSHADSQPSLRSHTESCPASWEHTPRP